jgi:hypothetical protein
VVYGCADSLQESDACPAIARNVCVAVSRDARDERVVAAYVVMRFKEKLTVPVNGFRSLSSCLISSSPTRRKFVEPLPVFGFNTYTLADASSGVPFSNVQVPVSVYELFRS